MKYIFTIIFIIIQFTAYSQIRYLDSLFVSNKTHKKLEYGNAKAINFPYLSEKFTRNKKLLADVYQPENDSLLKRPCIIVAHGGGFVIGSRKQINIKKASRYLAEKGYVVLSIDYRMGYNSLRSLSAERAVYRGIQDMKTAIRFVKENATTFRIDTNLVFAMGTSAGSMMSIHAAYFDESERVNIPATYKKPDLGCLSCSGNNFKHNDKPIAVANLWGAFIDTNFIQKNDVPMISFHGTKDVIVSANKRSPIRSPFFKAVSGSNILTPRLENLGISTHYHQFKNKRHEPWGILRTKPEFDTIMDKTAVFFFDVLLKSDQEMESKRNYIEISISENVKNRELVIDLINNESSYKILIINRLGVVIYSDCLNNDRATNSLKIPTSTFEKGDYYLIFHNKEQTISKFFTL